MLSQPSGSLNATCVWLFIQQLFTNSLCLGAQQCSGGGCPQAMKSLTFVYFFSS